MIKFVAIFFLSIQVFALSLPEVNTAESLSEKKRGNEFLQIIWDTNSVISDVESQVYLKKIGSEMVSYSPNPDKHFDFFFLNDKSINAFAGPYGYIGIHTGMLLESDSEAELAGVLAHEISHVTQNHLNRFIKKSDRQTYLMVAGMLAAALIDNSDASQAIAASTVAGTAQQNINFTREHEWEADRVGTAILKKSGYNPKGLADFFAKLENSENAKEFLRTHPLSVNRMADTVQRVARESGDYRDDSFEYLTIKARLYYHDNSRIKHSTNKDLALYMQAYDALESQKYSIAKDYILDLLNVNTTAPVLILAGRIFSKLGDIDKVKEYLLPLSDNESALYYLANAYFENNLTSNGIRMLKVYLRANGGTYQSNKLLSDLYVATSQFDRSHIYSAKALELQGKLEGAIGQYDRAKATTHSQDLFDVVNSKIDQLQKKIDLYQEID